MEESLFSLKETGGIELWEVMDAYKSCRRHKRNTMNALRFELNWEAECVSLWEVRACIDCWLSAHGHRLHPKKMYLQHYTKGVLFVGGMILPGRKYISRRTLGFLHTAFDECKRIANAAERCERVVATMNSYFGMLQHYDAYSLTTCLIRQLPASWYQWMSISRRGHQCKLAFAPSTKWAA